MPAPLVLTSLLLIQLLICAESIAALLHLLLPLTIRLVLTCTPAQSLSACSTQAAVQAAYDVWSAGFSFTGGTSATSNISELPILPSDANCTGANLSFNYTVTDACGSQTCTSSFTVAPATLVVLTCAPAQSLTACTSQAAVQAAYDVWSAGFSFTGGCPGATSNISDIPALPADASCAGTTLSFTFTVTDACGSHNCTSAFTVAPNTPPVIVCPPSPQVRTLEPGIRRYVTVGNEFDYISITDDCGTATVSNNLNNRATLDGYDFPTGVTTVIWTAVDDCGNSTECSFTVIIDSPGIELIKTGSYEDSNNDGIYNTGDHIIYTFIVTNTGSVTLTNVTITDPLITVLGGPIPSLAPGAVDNTTFTGTYSLTQADIDAGSITNTATASGRFRGRDYASTDDFTQPLIQNPALTITKTVDLATISQPGLLTYSITVVNTGNTSLSNVIVTDILPDGSNGTLTGPTGDGGTVGTLDVGETWTYSITYSVSQDDINAGDDLVNTATVDTDQTEPLSDDVTTTITRTSSLTITKTVDLATISQPGLLTYSITVVNTGNTSLSNVIVTDILPDGSNGTLTGPTGDGGTVGTLDVGETWTYSITYSVSQDDINAGDDLVNTATVDTDQTEPLSDDVTTTITRTSSLTITKTVDLPTLSQPGLLTYSITVVNTGNTSLSNVIVTDILPDGSNGTLTGPTGDGGTVGTLDVGETWTYSITYSVSQDDINAGDDLVNTATVDTDQTEPQSDDVTTTITRTSSLTITKTVDLATISQPGLLTYSITVVNTGNTSLSNVIVTDILPDGSNGTLTGPTGDGGTVGTLDVGETWTYSITYSVSQDDINAGDDLVNTATVDTDQTEPLSDDCYHNNNKDLQPYYHQDCRSCNH